MAFGKKFDKNKAKLKEKRKQQNRCSSARNSAASPLQAWNRLTTKTSTP